MLWDQISDASRLSLPLFLFHHSSLEDRNVPGSVKAAAAILHVYVPDVYIIRIVHVRHIVTRRYNPFNRNVREK